MHNIAEGLLPLAADINSVKEDPKNARKHPAGNIEAIKNSLVTYGQRKPIVVNSKTGIIEAGNGLLGAAKSLGWTQIAAVMVQDDPASATGFAIMDNQSTLLAEWDIPVLKELLLELEQSTFDMTGTGFTSEDIEELISQYEVDGIGMPDIPDGDKDPIQQMAFSLTSDQADTVLEAIEKAKGMGEFSDTGNGNSNGNALARICEMFIGQC